MNNEVILTREELETGCPDEWIVETLDCYKIKGGFRTRNEAENWAVCVGLDPVQWYDHNSGRGGYF